MRGSCFSLLLAILVTGLVASTDAAAPAIGIITASGDFRVGQAQVWDNSTLFDGALVETGAASSQLALSSGVKLQLASDSRARVFADRIEIEKGAAQLTAPVKYEVDARGLRVLTSPHARLRVGLAGARLVEVAAVSGIARVAGPHGLLLASLGPGTALSFDPQAPNPATLSGCLLAKDGALILQDETSGAVVELHGGDLAHDVGNRMAITGALSAAPPKVSIAREVVDVTSSKLTAQGGCLSAAMQLGASTSPPKSSSAGAPHGGLSTGAKAGIVAAVAGGAAAAAVAAKGSKKSTTSP